MKYSKTKSKGVAMKKVMGKKIKSAVSSFKKSLTKKPRSSKKKY